MSLKNWIENSLLRYRSNSYSFTQASKVNVSELLVGVGRNVGKRLNRGQTIWEKGDWDILVILDACRFDLYKESIGKYDWDSEEITSNTSIASHSLEFMQKTFDPSKYRREMSKTSLVCANKFTRKIDENILKQFYSFDEVWKYGWNDDLGNVTPETVADRGIDTWRNKDSEKMILWFMQPHLPFRNPPNSKKDNGKIETEDKIDPDVWHKIRGVNTQKLMSGSHIKTI